MSKSIITTSWDDGHPLDFKLAQLLSKNNLPGTFYIPLLNPEKEVMKPIEMKTLSKNFEIGGHTLNHKVLTLLSSEEMNNEIVKGKEELEKICGELISFAYPKGQYDKKIMKTVKKSGFKGARTAEMLHYKINDNYEYHPTIHATDRILLSRGKQIITSKNNDLSAYLLFTGTIFKKWEVIAKKTLDYVIKNGGIWHLWGHSWEIEDNRDWDALSNVLDYANKKGRENKAEFLTNGEIFTKF